MPSKQVLQASTINVLGKQVGYFVLLHSYSWWLKWMLLEIAMDLRYSGGVQPIVIYQLASGRISLSRHFCTAQFGCASFEIDFVGLCFSDA